VSEVRATPAPGNTEETVVVLLNGDFTDPGICIFIELKFNVVNYQPSTHGVKTC